MTALIIPFRQRTVVASTAAQGAGVCPPFHSAPAYPDYFNFDNLQVSGAGSSPPVAWQTGRGQDLLSNGSGAFDDDFDAMEPDWIRIAIAWALAAATGAVIGAWLA
jgi:hypothetical protein